MEACLLRQSKTGPTTSGGKAATPQEKIQMQGLSKPRLRLFSVTVRIMLVRAPVIIRRVHHSIHYRVLLLSSICSTKTLNNHDRQVVKQSINHVQGLTPKRRRSVQILVQKALRINHRRENLVGMFQSQRRREFRPLSSPSMHHLLRHLVNLGGLLKGLKLNRALMRWG